MKQYKIVLVALLGLILTGCYSKFETPEPELTYTDEIFEALNPGMVHISIANLKAKFGETSNTGTNNAFDATKYIRFVADKSECNQWEITNKWYDTGNYYIKGKVISNDEQGNVYKSLYIFDGTGAIELKLTNGLHLDYPCNLETKESMWVYVKVRGLFLGNFRMMLSLGDIPTSSYNSYGNYKYYANSNIVNPIKVKEHVFPGEKCLLSEGTKDTDDIYVVDKNNYDDIQGTNTTKFLGRLIRFKGLKVHYAGVQYPNADGSVSEHPVLANGGNTNPYPSWIATSGIQETLPTVPGGAVTVVVNRPWYQLAYSRNNVALYGSVCLTYRDDLADESTTHYTSEYGIYMLRTSGYSRFSGKYVPKHGAVGDVLAIYQIYASKSDYKGGENDWATYQLAANRIEDIQFEMEPSVAYPTWSAHLKWAEDNFPQYIYPVTPDPAAREAEVAAWKAAYLANKPANDGSSAWAKWNAWADWVVWILENTPEDSYLLPQQIVEDTDTIE